MILALDGEEDRQTRICSPVSNFDCSVCTFIGFTGLFVLLYIKTVK